ncbi:TetR/AcrR family transcriptional regulator [Cellulosimicrobium sp. NPDC057127]|uniref:TetR/AcrR family transcriptional regulator n=1 Tax=Cellulosimicrobium sp. NPDC057127 TaxID=3346026 RepID=UPI0036417F92
MQEGASRSRRSNEERTRATRGALVDAARTLFVTHGYAGTSTPQVAAAAHVTRGALYHHFVDKQDLFRAVVEAEAAAVAAEIERAATPADDAADDARHRLVTGADAYLDAMAVPGRTRLLLLDAPAVLGAAEADEVDARHARRTLRDGLADALGDDAPDDARLDALTLLLSAAFDRATLAGGAAARWAVTELVERVCAPRPTR